MRVVDLDGVMFVPVVDETHGGAVVELKMTVGEFFEKCCAGFKPEAVEAMPLRWLKDRANDTMRAPMYRRYVKMLIDEWEKEAGD